MPWLGDRRGNLVDWLTQCWVWATGRRIALADAPWLAGPIGRTRGIGAGFFEELAGREGLEIRRGADLGLLPDFDALAAPDFDPAAVSPAVADFYERAGAYELDSWAQWSGWFRPFGGMLATLFSRRLQQLNVPLGGLDTSRGVTSEVLQLVDPASGEVRHTAWVRRLVASGDVLYAGSYSLGHVPGRRGPCVKVVFPLPNGNAIVLMRPEAHPDGSFSVVSEGERFGDPGFYFTVDDGPGLLRARYVASMRERIHVYPGEDDAVRADHVLRFRGLTFLRLHYRLRPIPSPMPGPSTP
ncbi:hypothetical protein [Tautonia plasticadhaerens]|uniref:Uncharacterized protein n=1 Tax=Tautonia plasticadhaerens TaxID=2527974 RepID=A0A518HBG2_9BACT|nr:hypothetical protein [Tautonia plasticadhaerens]QDV38193.1 hypothetical protein ElP_61440 [Tautonia plasticadhaerens]